MDERIHLQRRVSMVIKTRWVLIGLTVTHLAITAVTYGLWSSASVLMQLLLIGAVIIGVVYNAILGLTYKRLNSLDVLNHWQVALDLIVATAMVHYGGGVVSDLWMLFVLVVIEAVLLLPRPGHVYAITFLAMFIYGFILTGQYAGWLRVFQSVAEMAVAPKMLPYIIDSWVWVAGILLTAAYVGLRLKKRFLEYERKLVRLSRTDGLTDLYNRGYFFRKLNDEVARAGRYSDTLAVLMFDLDRFKTLNDSLGHLKGDEALKKVSAVLRSSVRRREDEPRYEIDTPCRYGGDEFAIILPETGSHDISGMAERLRALIEKKLANEGVTASIGMAYYPADALTPQGLVKAADSALYRAKDAGGNRVVLASKKETAVHERAASATGGNAATRFQKLVAVFGMYAAYASIVIFMAGWLYLFEAVNPSAPRALPLLSPVKIHLGLMPERSYGPARVSYKILKAAETSVEPDKKTSAVDMPFQAEPILLPEEKAAVAQRDQKAESAGKKAEAEREKKEGDK